jgi:tRNA A-37 threonylcarbamoyl transferase component Bud32
MRTILISGYDLSEYGEQMQGSTLLTKPFEPGTLVDAIEQELARTGEAPTTAAQPHVASVAEPIAQEPIAPSLHAMDSPVETSEVAPVPGVPFAAAPPSVTAAPVPRAAATAFAASQPGSGASRPAPAAGSDGESLIGQTLGSYQIVNQLGEGRWGTVYSAVQTSINRPVGLKILDASKSHDQLTKGRFIADARAKAHVQHPTILSVYEAGEVDGRVFFAQEFVDGQNLAQMQESGQKITEPIALKILRTIGEGLSYLHVQTIPHSAVTASSIYLGNDGLPRLSNLATQYAEQSVPAENEIQVLGRALLPLLPSAQTLSPGLRALLGRMVQAGRMRSRASPKCFRQFARSSQKSCPPKWRKSARRTAPPSRLWKLRAGSSGSRSISPSAACSAPCCSSAGCFINTSFPQTSAPSSSRSPSRLASTRSAPRR